MATFEKVRDIIAATLNINPELVTETLSAGEIDQWDSMGNMAIIASLEETLKIEFPIDDLFELNSVKAFIEEIEKIS